MPPWKAYGRYGSVGIELVLSIAVGFYGGRWLDGRLGGHGSITLLGFLGGTAVGFRSLFRTAGLMMRDIERAERKDRGEDPWSDERDLSAPDPPDAKRPQQQRNSPSKNASEPKP